MKIKILSVIIVGSLLLIGCNHDAKYNELIIGKYYSVEHENIAENDEVLISVTIEGYEEFLPNNTSIEEGIIKFSILNRGSNVIIEYKYGPDTSKWQIKGGNLYYNSDVVLNFSLNFKSTNAKEYSEREAVRRFRRLIENNLIDKLKQFLIEEGDKPRKIIELNENRLVTENSEGEQTIQKRINLKNQQKSKEIHSPNLQLKEKPSIKNKKHTPKNIEETTTTNDNVFDSPPNASQNILTDEDLNKLSKQELQIMRNEIFARHGYIFRKGGKMDTFFRKQEWYKPKYKNVDHLLSEIEKENIKNIRKFEKK